MVNKLAVLIILLTTLFGCKSPQNGVFDIVKVPEGWFIMGENDGRKTNEPQREVYLDTFYIMKYEVTVKQFHNFIINSDYEAVAWKMEDEITHPDFPATNVLWEDADAFCRFYGMRLPSEAEWEKAARGTDGRIYPWGNDWINDGANTTETGQEGVASVGSFPAGASPYGALDMSGNAAEWVHDYFDYRYYTYAPNNNPTGPDAIMDYGLRGGSYALDKYFATTYLRDSSHSALPNPRAGFRCASDIMTE